MEHDERVEDWGGHGPRLVFSHANGLPPGSYRRMLETLSQRFQVQALRGRPLWTHEAPGTLLSWESFADDYCDWLEQTDARDIVGVGHSLGAVVTLMAAVRMPERFAHLTLIEPPAMPAWKAAVLSWMPEGVRMRGALAKKALTREDCWATRDAAFADLRTRRAFARIDDPGLWDYVRAGTRLRADGRVELAISRAWEAQIFSRVPRLWPWVDQVRVPVRVVRGVSSDAFTEEARRTWRMHRRDHHVAELEFAGHLLPLERPSETAWSVPSAAQSEACSAAQ